MRRVAKICTIISGLLLILGIVEWATNYKWQTGDQNPLFGNQNILLNDGTIILILAGFLLLGSGVMWYFALRKDHGEH